jgi:hypothetical protein
MQRKTRIPNTRLNRFYDEEDFQLELDMATDLIEGDMNFTIVVFRIDRANTQSDDVYGESNLGDVRFMAPVELKVILNLENGENKSYSPNGNLRYQDYGNLEFTVLQKQLDEKNTEINYGDIVGYSDRENNFKYFSVFDDDTINTDNQSSHFGYRGYFRRIKCTNIDPNLVNGI